MKPYKTIYALQDYLAYELEHVSAFKRDTFVVLTLGKDSMFDSIKAAAVEALGKEALEEKPGIVKLFVFFKNVSKESVVKGINELEYFGDCSEKDVVEFDRKDRHYFIVKVEFA